jgi:hypothetical protein
MKLIKYSSNLIGKDLKQKFREKEVSKCCHLVEWMARYCFALGCTNVGIAPIKENFYRIKTQLCFHYLLDKE